MRGFHEDATLASVRLFNAFFSEQDLYAVYSGPNVVPDLKFFAGDEQIGSGEVKTLVAPSKFELSSQLFERGKSRFPLPPGVGLWTVTLEDDCQLDKGIDLAVRSLTEGVQGSDSILQLKIELAQLGLQFLQHHPASSDNALRLNPPGSSFVYLEKGIDASRIMNYFLESHLYKYSVQEVLNDSRPLRQIFLWPCESQFPAEVCAAQEWPRLLPQSSLDLPKSVTHLWIGHKYPMGPDYARAWLFTEDLGWQLVESSDHKNGQESLALTKPQL